MQFSPKILGLNAGIFRDYFGQSRAGFSGLFSDSQELGSWDCFGQSKTNLSDCFRAVRN